MAIFTLFDNNKKEFPKPEDHPFKPPLLGYLKKNIPLTIRETVIGFAKENSNSALVEWLFEPLSKIKSEDGLNTADWLAAEGVYDYNKLPLEARAKLDAKLLAHFSSCTSETTIKGEAFQTGGLRKPFMYNALATNCEHYFNEIPEEKAILKPEQRKNILDALRSSGDKKHPEEILSSIQEGKLTFIQAGWAGKNTFDGESHAIAIGFCGDKMFIGNTGEGATESQDTFKVFTINPKRINFDLIKYVLELNTSNSEYAQSFIYHELPKIIEAEPLVNEKGKEFMPIGEELIYICLPDQGTAENCVFGAAKASLLFGVTIAALNDPAGNPSLYFDEFKRMELYSILHTFKTYCEKYYDAGTGLPRPGMEDLALSKEMLRDCWQSISEEIKLCGDYCHDHPWMLQDCIHFVEKNEKLGIFKPSELIQFKGLLKWMSRHKATKT